MKKFILSLFVGFVGIISFCSAGNFNIISRSFNTSCTDCSVSTTTFNSDLVCIVNLSCDYSYFAYNYDHGNFGGHLGLYPYENLYKGLGICSQDIIYYSVDIDCDYLVNYVNIDVDSVLSGNVDTNYCVENNFCPTCDPQYTSEQCQSVYGLVSSGELNTCQSDLNSCQSNTSGFNDLLNNCNSSLNACNSSLTSCFQNNCPVISGDIQWSSLYINDIQHEGSPIIDITLPEEISWDYSRDNNIFSVVVSGYNVDTEYIDGIIRTQNYKPTSEDFTQLVGMLAPYSKYLLFLLFIFIIWAWIKKPFKSKKL